MQNLKKTGELGDDLHVAIYYTFQLLAK